MTQGMLGNHIPNPIEQHAAEQQVWLHDDATCIPPGRLVENVFQFRLGHGRQIPLPSVLREFVANAIGQNETSRPWPRRRNCRGPPSRPPCPRPAAARSEPALCRTAISTALTVRRGNPSARPARRQSRDARWPRRLPPRECLAAHGRPRTAARARRRRDESAARPAVARLVRRNPSPIDGLANSRKQASTGAGSANWATSRAVARNSSRPICSREPCPTSSRPSLRAGKLRG